MGYQKIFYLKILNKGPKNSVPFEEHQFIKFAIHSATDRKINGRHLKNGNINDFSQKMAI